MKKTTPEEYLEKAKRSHPDKNYQYPFLEEELSVKGLRGKITIICPEHGAFKQNARSHIQPIRPQGCPKCYGNKKLTRDEFISRCEETHGGFYDYSLVEYKNQRSKILIICPIHGVFSQRAHDHMRGIGCIFCSGLNNRTNDEFIILSKNRWGDSFDYSKCNYINAKTSVVLICKKHGIEFSTNPGHHLRGVCSCPLCNKEATCKMSKQEKDLLSCLAENFSNLDIQENVKGFFKGNKKEVDIYIPSQNLAIEYNGIRWHSVDFNKDSHITKNVDLFNKNIYLVNIFEFEWVNNRNVVLKILNSLIENKSYSFFSIKKISENDAISFYINNSLTRFSCGEFYYGIFGDGNDLISCISCDIDKECFYIRHFCSVLKENEHLITSLVCYIKENIKNINKIEIFLSRRNLFLLKDFNNLNFKTKEHIEPKSVTCNIKNKYLENSLGNISQIYEIQDFGFNILQKDLG